MRSHGRKRVVIVEFKIKNHYKRGVMGLETVRREGSEQPL